MHWFLAQPRDELRQLASWMVHFRAPVYVCSASAERWDLDDEFNALVLEAKSMLLDYPNIIVCSGHAFWAAVKPFSSPNCRMHPFDAGWSCRFA